MVLFKRKLPATQVPPVLGRFWKWPPLLVRHRAPDPAFLGRAGFILATSLLSAPFRWYEQLRYGRAIRETTFTRPPIFIIGFMRTGTTHLHNLLCQDPRFAYLNTYQALVPEFYLSVEKWLKPAIQRWMPEHRPMDNMALTMDSPQEEEMALLSITPYSFYHQLVFPRSAPFYFRRYCLMQNIPTDELRRWKTHYTRLLQKTTYAAGGKQLVLKNPANTGRTAILQKMFPRARFIHITRDPYRTYLSNLHLYRVVLSICGLQHIEKKKLEDYILRFHRELMEKYRIDKQGLGENLIEIKFEALEQQPLAVLQNIYERLRLSDYSTAEPYFRRYLEQLDHYQKNSYTIDRDAIAKVNTHWSFAFEEFGYPRQGGSLFGFISDEQGSMC